MVRLDPDLPPSFTAATAIAAGLSRHQVQARVRSGRWRRLRRGVFCLERTWSEASDRDRHVLTGAAVLAARQSDLVLSHLSAAALWGLPLRPGIPPLPVWVTCPSGTGPTTPRRTTGMILEVAGLAAKDRATRHGLATTAPARTVADCLRHLRPFDAVPIADAAVHGGLTTPAEIARVMADQARWPLAQRAARTFPLIDGRRETWLESMSIVALTGCGIPVPLAQVEVLDGCGRFVGRVDFLWAEAGVAGEADGKIKYHAEAPPGSGLPPGSGFSPCPDLPPDSGAWRTVWDEKLREDALRDCGLEVVRWTAGEVLARPTVVAARIRRAMARARPERFTGRLVHPALHLESRGQGRSSAPEAAFRV